MEVQEGGAGLGNPVEKAVVQLSKIVAQLNRDKRVTKDKTLESLLGRAESGGVKDATSSTSGKSKAAALRSLKKMLVQEPQMIYQALEKRMEEDWTQTSAIPGASASTISARGWLEHRSKLQNFQVPVRAAWCFGGIWDALKDGRVEEARARAALATAAFDQLAIDRGSWLVASEILLEESPPFSSFSNHRALESWENPHTKLIDERWLELFLARLRDLHDCQEKRWKLAAGSRRSEDTQDKDKEKEAGKKKKKGKGGGKTGEEEKTSPST